ncbi:MAG: RNA polymerase sigma factor [Acidimicrobiales bacterium]
MTPDERRERFRTIFDAYHHEVDAYCRRRVPESSAADAVSETFLTAWRRFDDLPAGAEAKLWLFGVARNVLANQRRSETRRDHLHLRLVGEPTSPGTDLAEHVVGDPSPVLDALATLAPDDQDILTLITWEGLSHAEAARVLGCSTNAVAIRIHRARKRLADALTEVPS